MFYFYAQVYDDRDLLSVPHFTIIPQLSNRNSLCCNTTRYEIFNTFLLLVYTCMFLQELHREEQPQQEKQRRQNCKNSFSIIISHYSTNEVTQDPLSSPYICAETKEIFFGTILPNYKKYGVTIVFLLVR